MGRGSKIGASGAGGGSPQVVHLHVPSSHSGPGWPTTTHVLEAVARSGGLAAGCRGRGGQPASAQ